MNVYILKSDSYWEDGEYIGSNTHGVFNTKELAEQKMDSLPKWEQQDGWSMENKYTITEHKLIEL
jgi:hypothetical protein